MMTLLDEGIQQGEFRADLNPADGAWAHLYLCPCQAIQLR
jgi:hypothetical protein